MPTPPHGPAGTRSPVGVVAVAQAATKKASEHASAARISSAYAWSATGSIPGGAQLGDNTRMTLDEFRATTRSQTPPDVSPALVALWHDARGDWSAAHETAQNIDDAAGAWIHAYLHRKEGDAGNAGSWHA